jgi:diacylglycerol kinase family enzyme
MIVATLQKSGVEVEVQETGINRAAGSKARHAAAAGVDCVLVCGGDGTVFDVIQGMAGSSVPIGIFPFGTGNVVAQNLRIPKHPAAAARWMMRAEPRSIQLGKLTHCTPGGQQSWYFSMAAGMGVHAALMTAAGRSKKNGAGKAAYFTSGIGLLLTHTLTPFDVEITRASGEICLRRVCEAIAVRVPELNIWRPGGDFDLPSLRLATVETISQDRGRVANGSRWRLARAAIEGLFLRAGARDRKQRDNAPARYEDVLRVVCRPIPGLHYASPLAVQADGEVLDASCAVIEMSGVNVRVLADS